MTIKDSRQLIDESSGKDGHTVFLLLLSSHSSNLGQALYLADALQKENWNIRILCPASCRLAARAKNRGISVHLLPEAGGNKLAAIIKISWFIRSLSKQGKSPALIHAFDPEASQAASLAWRFNKKCRIVHTRRIPILDPNPKAVRCYQMPPAKIITDSLAGKIALRLSGMEGHLLHTIPCGIDASIQPRRRSRHDGRFLFAMTGEMMPDRGHIQLFDALRIFSSFTDLPPWEMRILGEGPYFGDLFHEAENRDITRNMAFLSGLDVGEELTRCDALVLPAPEGESYLPLILQGFAVHVPLIAVNRVDHAEMLQDGVNCLLAQPNEPQELADKMALLARDAALRQRLINGGNATLAKYNLSVMVAEHKRLYREILA
ncbi:hypothetical protein FACS1894206_02740 [Deltaproteobacteria bacterium]|nr:hypothetical protein FACS1894206_02740 [Deltaproteobacteria bacterium]